MPDKKVGKIFLKKKTHHHQHLAGYRRGCWMYSTNKKIDIFNIYTCGVYVSKGVLSQTHVKWFKYLDNPWCNTMMMQKALLSP